MPEQLLVGVIGAAGKTGRAIITALAGGPVHIRAVVHRPEQVAAVREAGATEVAVADLADPDSVVSAMAGVDTGYFMAPNVHPAEPNLFSPLWSRLDCRVVYHSVMHPWAPLMPHHRDKAEVETQLHQSVRDWTILQPASYMENAIGAIDTGRWRLPYRATAQFTPVALADLAAVAARVLTEPGHTFATYELAGPHALSTVEIADVLGHSVGVGISVEPESIRSWERRVGSHLSPSARSRLVAMFEYYDQFGFCGGSQVLASLLRRPPLTWQQWCQVNGAQAVGSLPAK